MHLPKTSQHLQRWWRQRHVSIFVALAANAQDPPAAVNLRYLEADSFADPKAATVNGRQTNAVKGHLHRLQNSLDLFLTEDHWQGPFFGWPDQIQHRPVLSQRLLEEKFNPAKSDSGGGLWIALFQLYVEKKIAPILFGG